MIGVTEQSDAITLIVSLGSESAFSVTIQMRDLDDPVVVATALRELASSFDPQKPWWRPNA